MLVKLNVPVCDPAAVQLNRTATVTLSPADTIAGSDGLITVNAA
jgi:hypothetical protein